MVMWAKKLTAVDQVTAVACIQSLTWQLPYTMDVSIKFFKSSL